MQEDQIGYDEIIENSMRSVIHETLKKVEKTGLLGKHYFVITFFTRFPGVSISKNMLEKYPDEMTIVIQFQYRDLEAGNDSFKISLCFGGEYEKLEIPYKSITSFADPSMNFALRFSVSYGESEDGGLEESDVSNQVNNENSGTKIDLSAKVVSLDAFRKNKDSNNPS